MSPPLRESFAGSPLRRRRVRRRGDAKPLCPGEVVDAAAASPGTFWIFASSAIWWCLQRCLEVEDADAGTTAAGSLVPWSVLGGWSAAGGSGHAPRLRRREEPGLEEEDELGDDPRPARHNDRWVPLVLLLEVHKAVSAMGLPLPRECWAALLGLAVLHGIGGERWRESGVADLSKDFFVIFLFSRVVSAKCTGPRVLLDRSGFCVRILYLHLALA